MREGSYTQIEPGMRVIGPDGRTIGGVTEVLYDEASDIFVGITVQHDSFSRPRMVHGEHVVRVHQGLVEINVDEHGMEPYQTPEERYRETAARNAA